MEPGSIYGETTVLDKKKIYSEHVQILPCDSLGSLIIIANFVSLHILTYNLN